MHHPVTTTAFDELERSVHAALETYSNVHRGSGHHSQVSTALFERARGIVLEYLGLPADRYVVIFGTPRTAVRLAATLEPGRFHVVSSQDVGVPLGVRALVVERRALPDRAPLLSGGGTARLVGPAWVMWASAPDRFEAGTPAVVNIVAFARALQLTKRMGNAAFAPAPGAGAPTAGDILFRDAFEGLGGFPLMRALQQTLVARSAVVPSSRGDRPYVNLDNAASTPTFEPVWAAVREAWRQPACVQQELVTRARTVVAEALGAPSSEYDVIFTGNTTDAINLVAEHMHGSVPPDSEQVVVNTYLEHNSNELPWRAIPGASVVRIPMDADGILDIDTLESVLRAYNQRREHGAKRVTLVAVTGASNVLGVFNDLDAIAAVAHRYGARFLVDGAQLVAHRAVDVAKTGIDYLAFSAHKVYAPFGTGVLVARRSAFALSAEKQELVRASGGENVGGIAALAKALVLLRRIGLGVVQDEEQALTARALRGLARIPGVKIYGISNPVSAAFARKGAVIPFDLKGTISHSVARALAIRGGIGVRSGCHCAHLTVKRMLGVPPWAEQLQRLILTVLRRFELPGVVRISLGIENSDEDVDAFVRVLGEIARKDTSGIAEATVRQRLDDACAAAVRRVFP
jgi:selenocysteine lyase/cysteine desulfurase